MHQNTDVTQTDSFDTAQLLSNFNHNTNLLLAGTEFTIFAPTDKVRGENASQLKSILTGFGAIVTNQVTETTRVIWAFDTDELEQAKQAASTLVINRQNDSLHTARYPLVVADASGQNAHETTDPELGTPVRPGIQREAGYYLVDCTRRAEFYLPEAASARIEWAKQFMPVSARAGAELGSSVSGKRVGIVLVLEPKTAVLALQMKEAGAQVAVFAPANETDQPVADYLAAHGVKVFASSTATSDEETGLAEDFLSWKPQILMDDGAHLLRRAHQRPEVLASLEWATEETTSGVRPLRAMEAEGKLQVPVIAVNDAHSKTFFDNRHGTGQTCVFATFDRVPTAATNWTIIGFGPVGQGTAQGAKALGRQVTIVETDSLRALEARTAGYQVTTLEQALSQSDVVVSATGYTGTITGEHLSAATPNTVFSVAGGIPGEIQMDEGVAANATKVDLGDHRLELQFPNQSVTILADGHGVNYTAAEGNPIEIMDLSFAAQLLALRELADGTAAAGIHLLSEKSDKQVAWWALEAAGFAATSATAPVQTEVASAWENDRYRVEPPVVVYSANLVFPITAPRIADGAVAVQDGKIIHVGERRWVIEALREAGQDFVEEHWDGVLTPGLVNAHTHLQYTDMDAVGSSHYLGFDDWAKAFDAVYDNLVDPDWLGSALRGTQLCLASGTTAAADVVTDQQAAAALHLAGLHGIAYWEVMGWSNEDWRERGRAQAIADLGQIPAIPGVGVSPHAPYSLEVQPLLDVPDLVRNLGMRLHIHLGEAHFERETTADENWPTLESPSFQALRREGVGVSSTKFVDQLGVLGPDCHIAHGVYMSAEDRSLLRARGTSVALCPRSNAVIGLDMPPIAAYLREGNQISVGTDSLSSSPSLDLLEDVALLYKVAREQGYAESDLHQRLLKAATLGGAGSLGLRAGALRTGQLAVGASADLAFFDIPESSPNDASAHLVEAGAGTCRRTIVAGVEKYRG